MKTTRFACLAAALLTAALFSARTTVDARPTVSERLKVKQAAAHLDGILARALRAGGEKPAELADESAWVRRTYLAIVGRIPTESELRTHLKSKANDRNYDLVDSLLESKGYGSHMFNWWADLLRARSRLPRRISGEPYIHWIKESIQSNKPVRRDGPGDAHGERARSTSVTTAPPAT